MFQPSPNTYESVRPAFDMAAMLERLSDLDNAELERIQDDLDFWHFTGCASPRLKALLAETETLRKAA